MLVQIQALKGFYYFILLNFKFKLIFFSVEEIVYSIPGADLTKTGSNIAKDLYEGKDLKSTIKERYAKTVMIKYDVVNDVI